MVTQYPAGLNHASMHATTGDMTLSGQVVTPKYLTLAGDPTHNLITGGTPASPITLTASGLFGVQIAVKSTATSGILTGADFSAIAGNASGDLELRGLHTLTRIPTGINVGAVLTRGFVTEMEVLGTGHAGYMMGGEIDLYADSTTTLSSDVIGLYLNSYLEKQPAGDYSLLRLEHNPNTVKVNTALIIASAGGGDYFLTIGGNTAATAGWDAGGDKTGLAKAGFLKVTLWGMPGGGDRYIQLYGP